MSSSAVSAVVSTPFNRKKFITELLDNPSEQVGEFIARIVGEADENVVLTFTGMNDEFAKLNANYDAKFERLIEERANAQNALRDKAYNEFQLRLEGLAKQVLGTSESTIAPEPVKQDPKSVRGQDQFAPNKKPKQKLGYVVKGTTDLGVQVNPGVQTDSGFNSRTCVFYLLNISSSSKSPYLQGGQPAKDAQGNEIRDKDGRNVVAPFGWFHCWFNYKGKSYSCYWLPNGKFCIVVLESGNLAFMCTEPNPNGKGTRVNFNGKFMSADAALTSLTVKGNWNPDMIKCITFIEVLEIDAQAQF